MKSNEVPMKFQLNGTCISVTISQRSNKIHQKSNKILEIHSFWIKYNFFEIFQGSQNLSLSLSEKKMKKVTFFLQKKTIMVTKYEIFRPSVLSKNALIRLSFFLTTEKKTKKKTKKDHIKIKYYIFIIIKCINMSVNASILYKS